jgi:hypothetical protein
MRYLKTFESIDEPKEGDYIIAKSTNRHIGTHAVDVFCRNNIGQIIGIIYDRIPDKPIYKVKYENVPAGLKISNLNNNIRGFFKKDFELWSKDKEELEAMIAAKKYNI